MKNFKKVVALSLAVLMVIAAVVVSPVTAKAEGETGTFTNLNGEIDSKAVNLLAHSYAPQISWIEEQGYNIYNWSTGMVLEFDPATELWEVVYTHVPGSSSEDGKNTALQQEYGLSEDGTIRVIILVHSDHEKVNKANYDFFVNNSAVGTKFEMVGDFWATICDDAGNVKEGAIDGLSLKLAEVDDAPAGDDTTTDEGTTDEPAIKDTGDNFVPMFVVLFAGLALVTVASVARKRA